MVTKQLGITVSHLDLTRAPLQEILVRKILGISWGVFISATWRCISHTRTQILSIAQLYLPKIEGTWAGVGPPLQLTGSGSRMPRVTFLRGIDSQTSFSNRWWDLDGGPRTPADHLEAEDQGSSLCFWGVTFSGAFE